MKAVAYVQKHQKDGVILDLDSVELPSNDFPLERFTPLAFLGSTAKATAILARDKQKGSKVAVKCFKNIAPSLQPVFESELKKNQKLNHTNIAKVDLFGFYNGKTPYLVTEYKDGFNVEQCVALYGIPSYDVAVKILIGICEASIYAQKESMLHRDIRPGNVIFIDDMNSEPSVILTDFDMPKLKLTEDLTNKSNAMWMSGDVARNLDYSEKSEIYTIGCIGYLLLTGRPPFSDGSSQDIKNAHALKLPPRISTVNFDTKRPRDLDEVIEKCMEKGPKDRFESVAKLLERLEVFPRREKMKIAAVLAARQRKKMLKAAAIGLAVAAVCALGAIVMSHH